MCLFLDCLRDVLRFFALLVAALLVLASVPFVAGRVADVLTGQDGEPRVNAAYWAERGYDTTENSLPPVADGKEKP